MKKIGFIVVSAVLMVFGGHVMSAQGKYGADSAECIKYLSYYKEYYKSKNYDSALPNWRKAYSLCPPTANQTMLVDGTTLVRKLIVKNAANAERVTVRIITFIPVDIPDKKFNLVKRKLNRAERKTNTATTLFSLAGGIMIARNIA